MCSLAMRSFSFTLLLLSPSLLVLTHHCDNFGSALLHTFQFLFFDTTSLFVCCEPLLSSSVFLFPIVGVCDHARIHGESLLSTDPCRSDGSIDSTLSEGCLRRKVSKAANSLAHHSAKRTRKKTPCPRQKRLDRAFTQREAFAFGLSQVHLAPPIN